MTQVISANRLVDGRVVYLSADGSWGEAIDAARLFATANETEAGLAAAQEDVARNLIIDPFLVGVAFSGGLLRAGSLRDEIRARGPTVGYAPTSISGASAAKRS
ncbi:DUF2849 domain-containing protein [Methylocapsa palsarum]|uniref:DUF2849 domain-containing protein n=1 Tax=Methylocapsa palsarum TaxID=1612308 RepID=A0A1I3ZJQ2_9HYPH|nr:DUF2849 domain-containing protein [Methylocapsa palsarum]SFK44274.1 Protein of unknown function [Methylocapsa palsarum]